MGSLEDLIILSFNGAQTTNMILKEYKQTSRSKASLEKDSTQAVKFCYLRSLPFLGLTWIDCGT